MLLRRWCPLMQALYCTQLQHSSKWMRSTAGLEAVLSAAVADLDAPLVSILSA